MDPDSKTGEQYHAHIDYRCTSSHAGLAHRGTPGEWASATWPRRRCATATQPESRFADYSAPGALFRGRSESCPRPLHPEDSAPLCEKRTPEGNCVLSVDCQPRDELADYPLLSGSLFARRGPISFIAGRFVRNALPAP